VAEEFPWFPRRPGKVKEFGRVFLHVHGYL
jgi:hypothetical protein